MTDPRAYRADWDQGWLAGRAMIPPPPNPAAMAGWAAYIEQRLLSPSYMVWRLQWRHVDMTIRQAVAKYIDAHRSPEEHDVVNVAVDRAHRAATGRTRVQPRQRRRRR